ncbi:MAG: MBG domain-containing protein, partial [Clostridia bacterium]|nr:MBG domain-containing protein [Clostridia bacterium]
MLKSYMTVEVKFVSFDELKTLDPGDYELQINTNGKLKAGDNKLKVKYGTVWSDDFPISGVVELIYKTITNIVLSNDTFTYPVTASEILAKITAVDVKMNDNSSGSLTAEQIASLMEVDGDLTVGTKDVTFKIKDTEAETDYEITINKGTLNPMVTFDDLTVTYDGNAKKIEATVSGLPEGFTLTPTYTVTGDATAHVADGYASAGTYNYSVSFNHTNGNYEQYTGTAEATLTIEKADYPGAGEIKFDGAMLTFDEAAHKLEVTDLPDGVTVKYFYNGTEQETPFEFTDINETGYSVTAKFTHTDGNYKTIADKTATLIISAKPTYDMTGVTFTNAE